MFLNCLLLLFFISEDERNLYITELKYPKKTVKVKNVLWNEKRKEKSFIFLLYEFSSISKVSFLIYFWKLVYMVWNYYIIILDSSYCLYEFSLDFVFFFFMLKKPTEKPDKNPIEKPIEKFNAFLFWDVDHFSDSVKCFSFQCFDSILFLEWQKFLYISFEKRSV